MRGLQAPRKPRLLAETRGPRPPHPCARDPPRVLLKRTPLLCSVSALAWLLSFFERRRNNEWELGGHSRAVSFSLPGRNTRASNVQRSRCGCSLRRRGRRANFLFYTRFRLAAVLGVEGTLRQEPRTAAAAGPSRRSEGSSRGPLSASRCKTPCSGAGISLPVATTKGHVRF